MVLVVLALLAVLATIALWVALYNFQMKVTDRNVTDSFYSAEGVLEQIRAGLQEEMADAMDDAWYDVMQRYTSFDDQDERETYFTQKYVYYLRSSIKYADASSTLADYTCSLDTLMGYVGSALAANTSLVSSSGSADYCSLSTTESAVVIKGLVVEYTDDEGYLSIIQTDIRMELPSMNLTQSKNLPELFSYPLIANGGITLSAGATGTQINGSVYAGSAQALDESSTDTASLTIANGAALTMTGGSYLIVDGDLTVNGTTSQDTFASYADGSLWAENIVVNSAAVTLEGSTYLADDLEINGTGSSVSFGDSASPASVYIGYGAGTSSSDGSSAIVINGTNTLLDLSGLTQMALAGYSYISTGSITSSSDITNADIQMASSISVKGDQIAYLLPAECIGTNSSHVSYYTKNPMTYKEYQTLLNLVDSGDYTLIDEDATITKTGNTLSDYLGSLSISDAYKLVFVPDTSADGGGYVYFYLNLESAQMITYFEDYYGADSSKLTKYTAFYTDGIQSLTDSAVIYTAGLYISSFDESGGTLTYAQGTSTDIDISSCIDSYAALCALLQEDDVSDTQKENTVFTNLIDESALTTFLTYCTGGKYATTVTAASGAKTAIDLINNESGSVYAPMSDASISGAEQDFIIATGDVKITGDMTGILIAKGEVTISGANNVIQTAAEADMKGILATELTGDLTGAGSAALYEFLDDGDAYVTTGTTGTDTGDQEIDLAELISYANWEKR